MGKWYRKLTKPSAKVKKELGKMIVSRILKNDKLVQIVCALFIKLYGII